MKRFISIILGVFMLVLTSCGDSRENASDVSTDENQVSFDEVDKLYELKDVCQFKVSSYRYIYNVDNEKTYLVIDLYYKNMSENAVLLENAVSGTVIYKNKYKYDMDIFFNGGGSSTKYSFLIDNYYESYYELRDDYEVEPLKEYDFNYVLELPEEIDNNESYDLSVDISDTIFTYNLKKNEKNTVSTKSQYSENVDVINKDSSTDDTSYSDTDESERVNDSTNSSHNVIHYQQSPNEIMYLNIESKRKIEGGYEFSYNVPSNVNYGMDFTVMSVTCDDENILDKIDLMNLSVPALETTSGTFTIISPALNEDSVFTIKGNWVSEFGNTEFRDFGYEFNMALIPDI